MFGFFGKENKPSLRVVVGLNQVDKIVPEGWNERLNTPTEVAEEQIERRCNDIITKLSKSVEIDKSQIEYYSALKRYRLIPLIGTVTRFAFAGFKLDHIQPADPFEMADKDVQEFVAEERAKRSKGKSKEVASKDLLLEELQKHLTREELNEVKQKFSQERQRPPKVAIFGKAGVGKTTTVNSLFNAKWKTSHTVVGTTKAQMKEFSLETGGTLEIVDLPGYGVSLGEDRENEKIYQQFIPSCDVVLLVLQANSRDFADDQEMLGKVVEWLKKSPTPER
jgi:GTP-binding protein EngB required for normal cell division